MSDQVQRRGGSTAQHSTFTGALREITVDTTKKTLVAHDGATPGGFPLLREDASNLSLTNLFKNTLSGCILSTAGSSTTMSISAGSAEDSTNTAMMALSAISKTTASWAVGTASGGLDTGAIANSTWYHFYVIKRIDTGVVDVLLSLSATAPTMPANYTLFRRIGSGKTNGSSQWTSFFQDGDYFTWVTSALDVNAANYGAGVAISATLSVPTGVKVDAIVLGIVVDSAVPYQSLLLTDLSSSDEAINNATNTDAFCTSINLPATCTKTVRTNTSGQIRVKNTTASATETTVIRTRGWIDTRGRLA